MVVAKNVHHEQGSKAIRPAESSSKRAYRMGACLDHMGIFPECILIRFPIVWFRLQYGSLYKVFAILGTAI